MDDYTPTPRCANPACGSPFLPEQDGQKYCSPRCREAMKKRRQRFRLRRGEQLVPPGTSEPDHWADIEAGRVDPDLAEHTDTYDVGLNDPGDVAWSDAYRVQMAVERIEARYRELARPLLTVQRRNGGVRLPKLVELETECADKIDAILRAHEHAQELGRAVRREPGRVAHAQERQDGIRAMQSLAADLPGGHRRHAPVDGARATSDVFGFGGQPGDAFGTDRDVYRRSAVARELGQRVYSPSGWV